MSEIRQALAEYGWGQPDYYDIFCEMAVSDTVDALHAAAARPGQTLAHGAYCRAKAAIFTTVAQDYSAETMGEVLSRFSNREIAPQLVSDWAETGLLPCHPYELHAMLAGYPELAVHIIPYVATRLLLRRTPRESL